MEKTPVRLRRGAAMALAALLLLFALALLLPVQAWAAAPTGASYEDSTANPGFGVLTINFDTAMDTSLINSASAGPLISLVPSIPGLDIELDKVTLETPGVCTWSNDGKSVSIDLHAAYQVYNSTSPLVPNTGYDVIINSLYDASNNLITPGTSAGTIIIYTSVVRAITTDKTLLNHQGGAVQVTLTGVALPATWLVGAVPDGQQAPPLRQPPAAAAKRAAPPAWRCPPTAPMPR